MEKYRDNYIEISFILEKIAFYFQNFILNEICPHAQINFSVINQINQRLWTKPPKNHFSNHLGSTLQFIHNCDPSKSFLNISGNSQRIFIHLGFFYWPLGLAAHNSSMIYYTGSEDERTSVVYSNSL